MQTIALVTGVTRDIGAAIARALKAEGHQVAATCHSNDEVAEAFVADAGISIFRWDVADEASCRSGVGVSNRNWDLSPFS
ncbi:MAG: SDR family oxidoreductase [Sphingobium sp.]